MRTTIDASRCRVTFRRVRLSLVRERTHHPYPAGPVRHAGQVVDLARTVIGVLVDTETRGILNIAIR